MVPTQYQVFVKGWRARTKKKMSKNRRGFWWKKISPLEEEIPNLETTLPETNVATENRPPQ